MIPEQKRTCISCDGRILPDQEFIKIGSRGPRPTFRHENYEHCQEALSFGTWHSRHRHNTPGLIEC